MLCLRIRYCFVLWIQKDSVLYNRLRLLKIQSVKFLNTNHWYSGSSLWNIKYNRSCWYCSLDTNSAIQSCLKTIFKFKPGKVWLTVTIQCIFTFLFFPISGYEWHCVWKGHWTRWKEPSIDICTHKERDEQNSTSHQRSVPWKRYFGTFLEGRLG